MQDESKVRGGLFGFVLLSLVIALPPWSIEDGQDMVQLPVGGVALQIVASAASRDLFRAGLASAYVLVALGATLLVEKLLERHSRRHDRRT